MSDIPRVYIGSEDEFEDSRGTFYPEDLPEDWRLSYYNTSFNSVMLDAATLIDQHVDDISGWLADIQLQFRFLVAVHAHFDADATHALHLRLQALGEHVGGIVVHTREFPLPDIEQLRQGLLTQLPVFVASDHSDEWAEIFDQGYFPCWRSLADVEQVEVGREFLHGVVMIAEVDREPRQLRKILETVDQHISAAGRFYLIYAHPQPDAQVMHNGITLCELLGIL